ncbi:MAG: tetratricopeptide repeat protein [Proteobacteria bacterium]|nr:tetratricopeptide repeat protein [Pseudomonadota bacterium]
MRDKNRYWDCLDQAMEASHGGRTEEALAWLDEALKAHPEGAEAHNSRGEILWDEGKVDEALAEFELATKADPKFVQAHLNRAELLVEEFGAYDESIAHCDRMLAGEGDLPRLDRNTEAEVYYLKSKALFYQDELDGSLFLVRRAMKAIKTAGEQAVFRAFEGQILFEMGRFEESRRQLERAVSLEPEAPHSLYYLGLVLERLGAAEESERAFARAAAIDADHYPIPMSITEEAFERAAREALDNLPRSIREEAERVPLLIEDFPSEDLIEHEDVSPQILGIFLGVSRTEAAATDQPHDLDRIILFKRNLEKACRDEQELIEEIRRTVTHEVGHYLGLDEDDLERLGIA